MKTEELKKEYLKQIKKYHKALDKEGFINVKPHHYRLGTLGLDLMRNGIDPRKLSIQGE